MLGNKSIKKNGQVVVWIIVAIALFALALVIFFITRSPKGTTIEANYDPQGYIKQCITYDVLTFVDKISFQGGFENPLSKIVFNNESITYLCKNEGNFKTCINQHPMLISEITDEIKNKLKSNIEDCFIQLETSLKEKNIQIESKAMTYNVELAPRRIIINIDKDMTLKEKESSQFIKNWRIDINHPLYNLANVAIEITNQEATYCYFEYAGFMMLYPDFLIKKRVLTEGTKIYTIVDVKSEKEFNMAIRSCVIPPGM